VEYKLYSVGVFFGPISTAVAEQFLARTRATGLGIAYNMAVMIFGGFAQFFVTWLIEATGSPIAPSFYVMFGANDSEPARKRLADSFSMWRDRIENGLAKMRERGELNASAKPHDLALALLSAVEGGLLLAKTTHSSRPLELSLDMAIDHVARHMTALTSAPTARVRQ
jgi:hypothetical protein